MILRVAPRQVLGDGVDSALDFAQTVDAGFAVVLAAVDDLDRRSAKKLGHAPKIDSVLGEIGFPLLFVPLEVHRLNMWWDRLAVSIHL